MRKHLAVFTFLLTLLPTAVSANDLNFHPYGGVDYQHVGISYASPYGNYLSDSLNGFDIHAGIRAWNYFGAELGYMWTADGTKNNLAGINGLNSSVNTQGVTLDAMGYVPISTSGVELIGTTGVGFLTDHVSLAYAGLSDSGDKSDTAFRIGGGAQYWFTNNVNVRGLLRYQTSSVSEIDSALMLNVGLNYQF